MSYPTFTNPQGFNITAQQYTRTHTPADAFPGFSARIPKDGIHAGQYSYFAWGARPDATPRTQPRVMPTDVIVKPRDGFSLRMNRYLKLLRRFTIHNEIFQKLLNEKKKTVGIAKLLNQRMQRAEAVRSLRNEVAGMTEAEAERRNYDMLNLAGTTAQTFNDINALIRGSLNTLNVYDQPGASSGGLAGQTAMVEEMEGVPQQGAGASYQPTPYPAAIDIQEDEAQPFTGAGKGMGVGRARFDEAGAVAEALATAPQVNSQVAEQLGHFARNVNESSGLNTGRDDLDDDEEDLLNMFYDVARDPDFRTVSGVEDATVADQMAEEIMSLIEPAQGMSVAEGGAAGGAGGPVMSFADWEEAMDAEREKRKRTPAREAKGRSRRQTATLRAQGLI